MPCSIPCLTHKKLSLFHFPNFLNVLQGLFLLPVVGIGVIKHVQADNALALLRALQVGHCRLLAQAGDSQLLASVL